MGGCLGGVVGPRLLDTRLDYDACRAAGTALGSASIVVLGAEACHVHAAADVMSYLAGESAQQCGACMRGTVAMREALAALLAASPTTPAWIVCAAGRPHSSGRGARGLLDAAAGIAGSLLREFPEAVAAHRAGTCDRCAAAVISPDRFTLTTDPPRMRRAGVGLCCPLIDIHDPEAYEAYAEAFDFASFATEYGGEILMVSDDPDIVEGEWNDRLVVLKFPSRAKAHAWYDSDEYEDVRTIRWAHASSNLAVHRGIDEPAAGEGIRGLAVRF